MAEVIPIYLPSGQGGMKQEVHVTVHKQEQQPDDLRFVKFRICQSQGWEEEEIAREFDLPTPKALYAQLAEDGYPVCKFCGAHTKNHSCREMREALLAKGKP